MEKRILNYAEYLLKICKESHTDEERKMLCEKALVQIGFFQHERFIHLIVTVLFAIMAIMVVCTCILKPTIMMLVLEVGILILLVPYIRHYFILENKVQQMYRCYDLLSGENWKGCGLDKSES